MANPTTTLKNPLSLPAILEATTTPATIYLSPNRVYEITHLGVDAAGNADTDDVMLGFEGTTAAQSSGVGKALLQSTKTVKVFAVSVMTIDAEGNNPILNITPLPR